MQELITFFSRHPLLSTAGIIVLALLILVELIRAKRHVFNITPAQATRLINHENAVVIDLRGKESYRNGHIIDAQPAKAQEIQKNPKTLLKFKGRPLVIVSASTQEAQKMASLLLKQGYNAYSLSGGIRAWTEAQMPLIKE